MKVKTVLLLILLIFFLPSCLDFSVVKKEEVNKELALKLLCASIQAYDITDANVDIPGYIFITSFKGQDLVKSGDGKSVLKPNFENFGKIYKSIETDSSGSPVSYIISFRGSSTVQNWISDFTFTYAGDYLNGSVPNLKVHAGIYNVYKTFKIETSETNSISLMGKFLSLALNSRTKIYITGHSLGGAIALLFTLDLIYNNNFSKENITMYNFAAPRVGNSVFAQTYNSRVNSANSKNSIRFINDNDIIPQLPATKIWKFEYKHVKNYYLFCFKPDQVNNGFQYIAECHVQKNYFKMLKRNLNSNYSCQNSDTTSDLNSCAPYNTYFMLGIGRYLQNNPGSMQNIPDWLKELLGL